MIPSLHYERPIYLDYSLPSPSAIINIDQEYEWYLFDLPFEAIKQQQSSLKPNEIYDITINLHIPSKQSMHDIGNVMLKLSLYSCSDQQREHYEYLSTDRYQTKYGWNLLRKSTRPILLKYESILIRIIKKMICIIPYCLGLWNEDKYLQIPIMSAFEEVHHNPTCAAVINLSTNNFHVYDASIYFDIQLQGIKYFLYHWWLTSSLVTVFMFTFICCITTSPALMLCCYQLNKIRDCYNKQNIHEEEQESIDDQNIINNDEEDAVPIPLLDDVQSTCSVSSPTSALLLTAPSSAQSNDNTERLLNVQSGLRRRKNITESQQ